MALWGDFMTFNATALISHAVGEIVRFTRKNSFIDLPVQYFKGIADFEGDKAVYRQPIGNNDYLVLSWAVRKPLKKLRGMTYGNMICTEKDLPYYQSDCVKLTMVNDNICITTLNFLNEIIRERLCLLLKSNIGVEFQNKSSKKDNVLSVSMTGNFKQKYITEISNTISAYLTNILRDRGMTVHSIAIENYSTEVVYNITLAVID